MLGLEIRVTYAMRHDGFFWRQYAGGRESDVCCDYYIRAGFHRSELWCRMSE
jgi:hypothetical protein